MTKANLQYCDTLYFIGLMFSTGIIWKDYIEETALFDAIKFG